MWRPRGCNICEHGVHVFVDPAEIESSSKHSFPGQKEREDRGHASRIVDGVPG